MDEYKKLLGRSLKLLGRRPRSEKEMHDFLEKKTSNTDLINQIISWLKQNKFINDEEFAAWYIESRSRSRPRGLRLLKLELKAKGVSTDNLQLTTNNESDLAYNALEKKMRLWKNLPEREAKQKVSRFLSSRGFPWSAIEVAVKKRYNDGDVSSDF